jgi:hypothetical protein
VSTRVDGFAELLSISTRRGFDESGHAVTRFGRQGRAPESPNETCGLRWFSGFRRLVRGGSAMYAGLQLFADSSHVNPRYFALPVKNSGSMGVEVA